MTQTVDGTRAIEALKKIIKNFTDEEKVEVVASIFIYFRPTVTGNWNLNLAMRYGSESEPERLTKAEC